MINDVTYQSYLVTGKQWLGEMQDKLHFDYSKNLFVERMTAIAHDDWGKQLAQDVDFDLSAYQ